MALHFRRITNGKKALFARIFPYSLSYAQKQQACVAGVQRETQQQTFD
jgi:hypothetical protein